jgi:transposase
MPAPYSYDFRTKAIEAVQRGERKSAVCRMLKISHNTLDLWLKRQEETGDYLCITGFQTGSGHKITDWVKLSGICQTARGQDPKRDGTVVGR